MTIREKIKQGKLYTDMGEGLSEERLRCKELVYEYNNTRPNEEKKRLEIINQLFKGIGKDPLIEPPLRLAYGCHTHIGDCLYANFNLIIVDDTDVSIGDNVMIAPNVTITATGHPVHPDLRRGGTQYSFPVTVEDDVWIGTGVIILPGITIGKNSVIGAGSVVTRDIPPNVVAVGNPCRVLRAITDRDKIYYYRGLKVE